MEVTIVDTGCANISSVRFAFERLGVLPQVSRDPNIVSSAERLVLPGVGSAPTAIAALRGADLIDPITTFSRPLLGICLGMQLLFEHSTEGREEGLGMLPGTIERLPAGAGPLPHMGWNRLNIVQNDPLLNGVEDGSYVYFLHSYAAPLTSETLAASAYGARFSAMVRRDNFMGCQFHPERSGSVGARILQNFLET